jgi:hypothetical protein
VTLFIITSDNKAKFLGGIYVKKEKIIKLLDASGKNEIQAIIIK